MSLASPPTNPLWLVFTLFVQFLANRGGVRILFVPRPAFDKFAKLFKGLIKNRGTHKGGAGD